MQIIVNKDRSIKAVEPTSIYQGSSKGDFLSIFAPFSVKHYSAIELENYPAIELENYPAIKLENYSAILVYFKLPNGEALGPRVAFGTQNIDGIGVWSMELDAKVTEHAGTVKCQLAFICNSDDEEGEVREKRTEMFEINVLPGIKPALPEKPSQDIYKDILSIIECIRKEGYDVLDGKITDINNALGEKLDKNPFSSSNSEKTRIVTVNPDGSLAATEITVGGGY